jgi:hypothetical protein
MKLMRVFRAVRANGATAQCPASLRGVALVASALLGSVATPALAGDEPSTKLVYCGEESCLRITGAREDSALMVKVNGHPVAAAGEHRWEVRLPLEVVRDWSEPFARTIEVSLHDPATQHETSTSVDLPIGVLGSPIELASLVVRIR